MAERTNKSRPKTTNPTPNPTPNPTHRRDGREEEAEQAEDEHRGDARAVRAHHRECRPHAHLEHAGLQPGRMGIANAKAHRRAGKARGAEGLEWGS
jgi:hypothetical protein